MKFRIQCEVGAGDKRLPSGSDRRRRSVRRRCCLASATWSSPAAAARPRCYRHAVRSRARPSLRPPPQQRHLQLPCTSPCEARISSSSPGAVALAKPLVIDPEPTVQATRPSMTIRRTCERFARDARRRPCDRRARRTRLPLAGRLDDEPACPACKSVVEHKLARRPSNGRQIFARDFFAVDPEAP